MRREEAPVIRQVHGGGRWFPGSPAELKKTVETCMRMADAPPIEGRPVAAVAPHAGYLYSGRVAGHTFRALRDRAAAGFAPDIVVVIGFCHRESFRGVAWMPGDGIETPLGVAPLDADAIRILSAEETLLFPEYAPHAGEWSAENEIPFVQAALPDARLVVGLMGSHDRALINTLVAALQRLADERSIVVIASSDLLHDADYDTVSRTDRETLSRVAALDADGLLASWSPGRQVCCGIGPVTTAMLFARARGCRQGVVLRYRNSGDDFPESRGQWVVGYGSVVFSVP